MTLLGDALDEARVLDLFAGSGALGLEALSRGARSVDFVENGAQALHALKANVAKLKLKTRVRIFKRDAVPWVTALERHAYDVAFLDPPYRSGKLDLVVDRWKKVPFSRILVVEHAHDHDVGLRGKRYDFEGETRVTIARS